MVTVPLNNGRSGKSQLHSRSPQLHVSKPIFSRDQTYETLFSRLEVSLPYMFPGNIDSGSDVLAWQLLATLGLCARNEYETRLVVAARDRVNATVALAKTLPPTEARERLSGVALFLRSLHLRVEDLM